MKNKLLAVLLSAVVAFGLWMYVVTVVSPESEKTYYEIPVVLQNKNILSERGLMIVSDDPKVTLVLKSDRTILNDLNEANINVITNVANIEKPGTHNLTYEISYPGNIPGNEISVQSSSTDLITLKVENKIRKIIPVEIDYGSTAVPEGYVADVKNVELDHTSVEVSGPESVMDQIEKAVIKVDLSNQTSLLVGEYQYTLCNAAGEPVNAAKVTTNVEKVSLILKIQRVKEIALKLDIIDGGGATTENCTITMDTKQIQISGSDALLEDLNELVVGTVNLGEIMEDKTMTFPIELPEGVTNQTGVEQVTVDIKLPKLKTKTLRVTNIKAENVPSGLMADIITKELQVTVRGPEKLIGAIKESDLTVVVNLAQEQEGIVTITADVVVSEAFEGVGAISTHQVSVSLKNG